ncbi:psmD3, partial [Symbiodinium sp. KB8]
VEMQGEATEEAKEGETPAEPIKFDVSMDKMKEEVKEQFLFMFEAYMQYLILTGLVRNGSYDAAIALSTDLLSLLDKIGKRCTSHLFARAYEIFSLAHERKGSYDSIRPTLMAAYQAATNRHDDFSKATLLNLLLRNYLEFHMVEQARKLIDNTTVSETVSNNQRVRYLFYRGRIEAIQLDYSDAFATLTEAIRKAPSNTALGFRVLVQKFAIIVQMLMGEIPERSIFKHPEMKGHLHPYLQLTQVRSYVDFLQWGRLTRILQAVNGGDTRNYEEIVQRHS